MKYFYLVLILLGLKSASAQEFWMDIQKNEISSTGIRERKEFPVSFRTMRLDLIGMKGQLHRSVSEKAADAFINGPVISLPLPDGRFGRFIVAESSFFPDQLKQLFPQIRTYTAIGVDDPHAVAKIDHTEFGFHAMIMSPHGWVFIDPFHLGNTLDYICYYKRDSRRNEDFICETAGQRVSVPDFQQQQFSVERSSGTQLRTYRVAVACTGEYAAYYGGTVSGALSGIVTSTNRVDGVYQSEVSVQLTLIPNNNLIVYTNAATDPYTNGSGTTMLGENVTNLNAVIGSANFDIGHVYSTGGGGVAGLGVVCTSNKARGVTGRNAPIGDAFDIDYVAHEIGHQFAGNHTFNSVTGSCNGNRASSAAYEVGSGTTIMAYAGICGSDNIQPNSDPIFHAKSYDEIQTFITTGSGNSCPVLTNTTNNPPTINAGPNYTIPFQTPFELTGSGTDPDGHPLTFLWEQYDLASSGGTISATSTTNPIFRDFVPVTSGSRTFPRMSDIVNNTTTFGEVLPAVARSLNFKFTARDNRPLGGGVTNNNTNVVLTVVNTTTPFAVTAPNTSLTWFSGTTQTVTWNVSGTNSGSINCANVSISLSTDGGFTYPTVLASSVPNNGSASIVVPNITTTTARVKVAAVGNIFFDISNANFTISTSSPTLSSITVTPVSPTNLCAGAGLNVGFSANGPPNSGNIYTAQLSAANGSFTSPVNIGTLASVSTTGTISCVIPAGTAQGTGYRIRVISSDPAIIGSDNGSNLSVFRTVSNAGAITGAVTVCQGQTGVIYSVAAITNATTYTWTLPSGASITAGSNTNSITVSYSVSASSGNVSVTGSNPCSTGGSSTVSVLVNSIPVAAGTITGAVAVCTGSQITYSVPTILNSTGYNWTVPSGSSIVSGANTNSIMVVAGSTSGTITVAGTNSCGAGTSSSISIVPIAPPPTPVITPSGPFIACDGGSITLSVNQQAGIAYQWQLNSIPIAGVTAELYDAGATGSYSVVATQSTQATLTLTNATTVSILDNTCTPASSIINVSGFTSSIQSSQIQVRLNITHTYVGDLVIVLQAPNGSVLGLSNRTGLSSNSGDNFVNTVFTDAAAAVLPSSGAPYTGSYKPVATTFTVCTTTTTNVTSFGAIGGGNINPNGNWTLLVFDRASTDVGTINNWSLILPTPITNCTAVSNSVNVTEQNTPVLGSLSPASGAAGTPVSISGSGFTGTSSVTFNGTASAFTVVNDGTITTTVPAGFSTGLVVVTNSCGSSNGIIFSSGAMLAVKVFIEGFYRGGGQMIGVLSAGASDSLQISLASISSPYAIIQSQKAIMDIAGNCTVEFPSALAGSSYYIVLSHRNSLQTWSRLPVLLGTSVTNYDFTTSANQAFSSNQVDLGGVFAIRSGDVNQDGFIDNNDIVQSQIALTGFATGYVANDITGDRVVESADFSLLENNAAAGYSVAKP